MHSFVMLIATRKSTSALHASACTGRVWSGSDHSRARHLSQVPQVEQPRRVEMCRVTASTEEDSTPKQMIPYTTGAPDS